MHKIILALTALFIIYLAGCSSGGNSDTSTEDGVLDEVPSTEQTGTDTDAPEQPQPAEEVIPDSPPVTVDPTPTNPLEGIGSVQNLGSGFGFLEGPAYRTSDNSVLFSDIPANTIFQLNADGSIEPFLENQPTNGLLFDADNRLLIATHGGRTLARQEETGSITVLADRFEGALLNSPNDIALHNNGDVYFTDPPFGIAPDASEVGCSGVYRLTADGNLSRFWCNGIDSRPNGIGLSPNQDQLYVAFTFSGDILRWSVAADGSIGEMTQFATTAGNADGMAIDADGNLFVTSIAGVEVFSPDGTLWGTIEVPETPSNCVLGGPDGNTLFITARTGLYSVQLQ